MKKFLAKTKCIFTMLCLALIVCLSGIFVACGGEETSGSVALNRTSVKIQQYDKVVLTASVTGDLSVDDVVWSTSNASIATVENGTVTALAVGNAEITASVGEYSAKCAVNVVEQTNLAKVTLSQEDATLRVGGSIEISGSIVYRGDVVNGELVWESSDESIVTVNNGKLTGVKAGEATVTATATYQGELVSNTVAVTVKEDVDLLFGEMKVYLKTNEILDPNKTTYQFAPQIRHNGNAVAVEYSYASSDENVITVTNSGEVVAVAKGNAYVTVHATVTEGALEGKEYSENIEFNVEKSTLTLSADSTTFEVYSGAVDTVPTPNGYEVNLATYGLTGDESTVVTLSANGKTSVDETTLKNGNGTVVVSGDAFGGSLYGNVEYAIETATATVYGEIENVVTKYLDDEADLANMFFYGGIQANVTGKPYDGYFIMTKNIKLQYYPVLENRKLYQHNTNYEGTWGFQGIFDGQGYTISDLLAFGTFGGIFGNVGINATVKNLGVKAELRPTYSGTTSFEPFILGFNFAGVLQNVYVDVFVGNASNPKGVYYPIAGNLTHAKLKDVVVKFDATAVESIAPVTNPSKPNEIWTAGAGLLCGQLGKYSGSWVFGAELANVYVFYKGPKCEVGAWYTTGSTAYPYKDVSGIVKYGYNESASVALVDTAYWDLTGAQPIFASAK